jgi:hypothetical protein
MILDYINEAAEDAIKEQIGDSFNEEISNEPFLEASTTTDEPGTDEPLAENLNGLPERSLKEQVASWDPVWLQISLNDPEIKFAVSKASEVMLIPLTRHRLPSELCNSLVFAFQTLP